MKLQEQISRMQEMMGLIKENLTFYHGGLSPDATLSDIDVFRLSSRQQKRGRDYAGFYMSPDIEADSFALQYHKSNEGSGLHKITLPSDAKAYEYSSPMERITRTELIYLFEKGYDYISGKNLFGNPEYILLNKNIADLELVSNDTGDDETSYRLDIDSNNDGTNNFNQPIQEQISRMKSMMGLNEVTNPYKVNWEEPTREYFVQELDELLGNEMRFSKGEFFHPNNYDLMYSLFPYTFKTIAEHAKGEPIESDEEIKEILLNKEIQDLMDDWGEYRHVLKKDPRAQEEGLNFFNMGNMKVWKGTEPDTGEYVDNIDNTFYMGKVGSFMEWNPEYKDTTSSGLIKQFENPENEQQLRGYKGNIEQYKEFAKKGEERSLPAPFVIKLPTNDREGKEYILIGGHKRSATALQLGVEPIKVWLIDLTK